MEYLTYYIDNSFILLDEFAKDGLAQTIAVASLILLVTAIIASIVTHFLRHILAHDDTVVPSCSIFVNIARVVLWCMGIGVMLRICFNVNLNALVAALGVGGVALSLGLKDTISNLIGGLQVSLGGIIEPGDRIRVTGNEGLVHDVTWRHTTIDTILGERVVIPNAVINANELVKLPPLQKIVVPVYVTAGYANLDELSSAMEQQANAAAREVATIHLPAEIAFTAVTEFACEGKLILWITEDDPDTYLKTRDAIVRAVAGYTNNEIETAPA